MKDSNVLEKNKIKILRVQILMTGYLLALLLLCVIKIVSCVRKILMVWINEKKNGKNIKILAKY